MLCMDSLVAVMRPTLQLRCTGFSSQQLLLLRNTGPWAHWLQWIVVALGLVACSIVESYLLGPGMEPLSSALATDS